MMPENSNQLEPLYQRIEEYRKTSVQLFKLKAVEKTAELVSSYVLKTILVVVFSLATVFASIGLSIWLGQYVGNLYLGFVYMACVYCVLGFFLCFFMRNYIKNRLMNSMVLQMSQSKS
jgi:hypothetical protein